jgi:hypothetical protein
VGNGYLRKVRRGIKRGVKVVSSVDTQQLDREEAVQFSIVFNSLGALSQAVRPGVAKRIEKAIRDSPLEISAHYVLRLMSGKK